MSRERSATCPPGGLEAIRQLLALAALAPSSHNCQPWHVSLLDAHGHPHADSGAAPHALVVGIDRRRALNALPAMQGEMHISAGGFAAILLNLLRLSGWQAHASLLPGARTTQHDALDLEPLARIELGAFDPGRRSAGLAALADALRRRCTDRGLYRGDFALQDAMRQDVLPHSLAGAQASEPWHWHAVQPGLRYDQLGAFYRQHAMRDFVHGPAWRETYRHLVFSGAGQPRDGVGINIQSLFGPMPAWRRCLHRVVLHPLLLGALGPFGASARAGAQIERLIHSSPAVVYLSTAASHAQAPCRHVLAGEAIARLWLAASVSGLSLHPLSVALQHPDLRARLGHLLGCDEELLFIARAGVPRRPANPALRYRRAPSAFCSPPLAAGTAAAHHRTQE